MKHLKQQIIAFSLVVLCLLSLSETAWAAKKFNGVWRVTITIPVAPGSRETRTFTVEINASPREEDSLHGRMTITDSDNQIVGGVWRQEGKMVSIGYELPCASGETCASLVMRGKMKNGFTTIKKGSVIVMWDTQNDANYALYDTSNGNFSAERLE
jgi:hypothetical protein